MRIRPITVFLILAMVVLAAPAAPAADLADGICGHPWNVREHELEGFSRHSATELFTFFAAPAGTEIIDGAPASEILFAFGKNGLFAVYARPQSTRAYNTAMDAMLEEFGNPVVSRNQGVTFYVWEKADMKIKFVRDMNKNTRAMAFYRPEAVRPDRRQTMEQHADDAGGCIPAPAAGQTYKRGLLEF